MKPRTPSAQTPSPSGKPSPAGTPAKAPKPAASRPQPQAGKPSPAEPLREPSFWNFLFQKPQRFELLGFVLLYLLIFIPYRLTFPHLFVYSDSGMYLYSGITGVWDIYRPMGYSWFIWFAGMFGTSEFVLFLLQYLLSSVATLSFLFTLKYLFPSWKKAVFYPLGLLMVLSPSIMYANNMLMSDSFFCSLTLLWLTTGLWLLRRPGYGTIALHICLLGLAVMTRYIGLFYILMTILTALTLFRRYRIPAIVLIVLAVLTFQWSRSLTSRKMAETIGVETFSGFGGWQLLNNAVVILPHVALRDAQLPNEKFRELYHDLRSFSDSLYSTEMALSTTLMWNNRLPLKIILQKHLYQYGRGYGEQWVRTGITYGAFASFLIRKYPGLYLKHYIVPSLIRFFKHHEFIEERVPLVPNQEMRAYFGLDFEKYEYQSDIFQKLNPVRQYTHLIPWFAFALLLCLTALRIKSLWQQPEIFYPAVLISLFVLAYFLASGVASGNTTWRYSITVYQPLLASVWVLGTLWFRERVSARE